METKFNPEQGQTPVINGRLNVTRHNLLDGVKYEFELVDGNVIGITLEFIQVGLADLVKVHGDYIHVGQYLFQILGYQSPAILVCELCKGETL